MQKFTVDYMINKLNVCYSPYKLKRLWGDKKSLTALEILNLNIPTKDKIWFCDMYPKNKIWFCDMYPIVYGLPYETFFVFSKRVRNKVANRLYKDILQIILRRMPESKHLICKLQRRNYPNAVRDCRKIIESIRDSFSYCYDINLPEGNSKKIKEIRLVVSFLKGVLEEGNTIYLNFFLVNTLYIFGYGNHVLKVVKEVLRDEEEKSWH